MELISRQVLKENKHHGEKTFPLAVYMLDQQGGDTPIVDCHWHKEVEFFYCLEGEVLFQINNDFIHIKQGELLFIDSEEIHTGHPVNDSICKFAAVVLDAAMLNSNELDTIQTHYISPFHERRKTFQRHITIKEIWGAQCINYIEQIIFAYTNKNNGSELLIKANLLLMLHLLYKYDVTSNRAVTSQLQNSQTEKLKKVISYIHENYYQAISIRDLANLIPMSEGHFCRFFKKMTRQTVTEFINSYRLKQAALLINNTELKISVIALEVGFEHLSYFIKLFQQHYNMSPTQYRKQSVEN